MPSRSTSSTDPGAAHVGRPVLGLPSTAAGAEPLLGPTGEAAAAGWRADGASTDWCSFRAASVVGVRHRLAGQGPEDSYAWALDEVALAVAVADGVGSRPGSAVTAAKACTVATQRALALAASPPADAVTAAIEAANAASNDGGATTLVVALVRRDGGGAVGRVGDSSAWSIDPEGGAEELFTPPDPDRADTVTAALPMSDVAPGVRSIAAGPGTLLALATDGIADPWRDGPGTVAPAMVAALLERPDPLQLLAVTDFSRKGCHDDRTLVCVWID